MNQIFLNNFSHPVMIVVPAGDGVGGRFGLLGAVAHGHPHSGRSEHGQVVGGVPRRHGVFDRNAQPLGQLHQSVALAQSQGNDLQVLLTGEKGVQLLGVFLQHPLAERLQRGFGFVVDDQKLGGGLGQSRHVGEDGVLHEDEGAVAPHHVVVAPGLHQHKSAARNYDVLFCARTFEKNFEDAKKAGTVVIPLRNVMSAPRNRAGFEGRRSAVRDRTEIEKEGNTVMIQFSYTIRDELGIHARPAGQLAKVAKSFEPTVISITKEGKTVKASQLMKLMGLAIKKGHEITITVEGEREEEAAAAMKKFLEENL